MPCRQAGQNGVVSGRICRRIRRQKRQSEDSAFIIPLFMQRCKENSAADDGYFGGFPTRAAVACKSGKASVSVYTANRRGSHRPPQPPGTLRRLSDMGGRRMQKRKSVRSCLYSEPPRKPPSATAAGHSLTAFRRGCRHGTQAKIRPFPMQRCRAVRIPSATEAFLHAAAKRRKISKTPAVL